MAIAAHPYVSQHSASQAFSTIVGVTIALLLAMGLLNLSIQPSAATSTTANASVFFAPQTMQNSAESDAVLPIDEDSPRACCWNEG